MSCPILPVIENRLSDLIEIRSRLCDKLDSLIREDRLLEREEEILREALESFKNMEN